MGDRYFISVRCPKCDYVDSDVYYAPTCGFINWNCPECNYEIDLEKYTGITYEDASNASIIKDICNRYQDK